MLHCKVSLESMSFFTVCVHSHSVYVWQMHKSISHTTIYCKAAFLNSSSSQKNKCQRNNKIFNFSCQLEYGWECLSPFTYKCPLLSSQGLAKVLLSSPWCAWCTLRKWEDTQCILPLVPSFRIFFFCAPLVCCNLCIQTGVHRLCFHFTEIWGSMLFE